MRANAVALLRSALADDEPGQVAGYPGVSR